MMHAASAGDPAQKRRRISGLAKHFLIDARMLIVGLTVWANVFGKDNMLHILVFTERLRYA
jgi:hypothetical protein